MTTGVLLLAIGIGIGTWVIARRLIDVRSLSASGVEQKGMLFMFCRRVGRLLAGQESRIIAQKIERDTELIRKAGLTNEWLDSDLLGMQALGALGLAILFHFAMFVPPLFRLAFGLWAGWSLPYRRVRTRRQERQLEIECEFPTVVDLVMLGVQGGVDFVSGLREVVDNCPPSPLRESIATTLHRIRMGEGRGDALRKMMDEVDSVEIRTTLLGLVQTLETGGGIAETLQVQSEQLRFGRLMRAERAAAEAPTKMLFPMTVFILPCIFIVVFGPLIMSIIAAFRSF